ncbi:MAG TPA: CpsB/CapC family capsule biosynthesis tyrosine phosphatase [Rhodanobacteraceae bacterium]|jgi:protein-tyrosine phosphatase|nr:CpsB/CapC family capsule biosynthesis tyrosine phosphatase [Rhodanobacteraceae bacterium]
MLDLHCHILPGIDDGAKDLDTALAMAQIAIDDGIDTIACTPHIYPGMYENTAAGIRAAIVALQAELDQRGMPLKLLEGADVYLEPDLDAAIKADRVPTLAGSRYLLLEPPHHVMPPRFEETVFGLKMAGYVPVITHPERLTWIPDHYDVLARMVSAGAWMQITSGSITGRFGGGPKHVSERMLDDGLVHLIATDAHNLSRRTPHLAEGRDAAARRVGEEEAGHLVTTRPAGIVADIPPEQLPPLPQPKPERRQRPRSLWQKLVGGDKVRW